MTITTEDKERAVETLMHNIASCVHYGMHSRRITKSELKELLVDWEDKTILDDMLAATGAHRIRCDHLSDVAFVLGFDWEFKIRPLPIPQPVDELVKAQADVQ